MAAAARDAFLESVRRLPVNWASIRTVLVDPLIGSIKSLRTAHGGRLDDLERRLAALESRKTWTYRGVWQEGKTYAEGDAVTCNGSMWHCSASTSERPGDGATSWLLCVKRGAMERTCDDHPRRGPRTDGRR
ncbi:MAG: carbohydrate-binding protein [Vicinamibacterales bacterium]